MHVALRTVEPGDLDAIFEQMRDAESVHLAAFTAEDPDGWAAFDAHMARIMSLPGVTLRAVTAHSLLVRGHRLELSR